MQTFKYLTASLLAAAAIGAPGASAFLMMAKQMVLSRLDPIVAPGAVSQHVHTVVGGSEFSKDYSYERYNGADCTSVDNSADKSNYWSPMVYGRHNNGTFSPLPQVEGRLYYFSRQDGTTKAFPKGLKMVAGNNYCRDEKCASLMPDGSSDGVATAVWTCQQGKAGGPNWFKRGFPQLLCNDYLRATIVFPDCWNGKDLDSADHRSHMHVSDGGKCPASHPVPVPKINLEFGYKSKDFDYRTLHLSNGDTTGYSLHADFANGWDIDVLQRALEDPTCHARENNFGDQLQCNALKATYNNDAAKACKAKATIPQEPVGLTAPLPLLPGCNLDWNRGTTAKPTCSAERTAAVNVAIGPANGWFTYGYMQGNANTVPIYNGGSVLSGNPAYPATTTSSSSTSSKPTTSKTATATSSKPTTTKKACPPKTKKTRTIKISKTLTKTVKATVSA